MGCVDCTNQLFELETELNKRGFSTYDIFSGSPSPKKPIVFQKLIDILNNGLADFELSKGAFPLESFFKAIDRQIDADFYNETGANLQKTITMVSRLCQTDCLKLENKQISQIDLTAKAINRPAVRKFVVNSITRGIKDDDSNTSPTNSKALEGIIMQNGDFIPLGKCRHPWLVSLLTAQGKDLKGALRLTYSPKCNFILSSFKDFDEVCEQFNDEMSISITNKQAETLVELYDGLTSCPNVDTTLNLILCESSNLGYSLEDHLFDRKYYDDDIAEENLTKIYRAVDKKYNITQNPRRSLDSFRVLERALKDNEYKRGLIISRENNQPQ